MFVMSQQRAMDDQFPTMIEMSEAELALVSGAGRPATDGVISTQDAVPMPYRGV